MARVGQELRYAARLLAKNPAFTVTAVLTLGIGIGMNTAIFSAANALLLRPLPYAAPQRLVALNGARTDQARSRRPFTYQRFTFSRDRCRSFSGVAAYIGELFNLTDAGDPEQLPSARVSWNFFEVLGARPERGRSFLDTEDVTGANPVVMISHQLWMRRFNGDAGIIGRHITLDLKDYTIIGVMPSDFQFGLLGPTVDIWAPRPFEPNFLTPAQVQAGTGYMNVIARLKDNVEAGAAQAEMDVVNGQYKLAFPKLVDAHPKFQVQIADLQGQLVANIRPALLILFAAVGLVLLIACANVANLLLSRMVSRKKELAIRAALGAGRGGLIGQLLIESLLLASLGGLLGCALSAWSMRGLSTMVQQVLPGTPDLKIDLQVLLFTLAISLLTGIIFGLTPSLQFSRTDLNTALRDEVRGNGAGRSRSRTTSALVVSQVGLSMVLLIGAALVVQSFVRLRNFNMGFDPARLLTMNLTLPPAKYATNQQKVAFFKQTVDAMRVLPGVTSAGISSALPVAPNRFAPVLIDGQPMLPLSQRPVVNIQTIDPEYAATLRIPIEAGRNFSEQDLPAGPSVILINHALAHQFWPNENPIGKRITLGLSPQPSEVVGVLGDVPNISVAQGPQPEVYQAHAQAPLASMNLTVRTQGDPHALVSAVRAAIRSLDPDESIVALLTMEETFAVSRAQPRLIMLLLGLFSGTALVLAVIGIYGVINYSVTQRTRELGIRMALGADSAAIVRLVVGQGMILALAGIAAGTLAALALTRLLASQLFEVGATDPVTFTLSGLVFVVVALGASYLPARRATRVDPTEALR